MFTADALRGPLHFLLEMDFGGRSLRFSSQRLTATIDGTEYEYGDGLQWGRAWQQDLSPYSVDPPQVAVDVTLSPESGVDVAGMIADGHNPGSATGVLSVYSDIDQRAETLIDGCMRDPRWGDSDEPFVASLEQNPRDDTGVIQSRRKRVLAASWASHDFAVNKEYYPVVVGSPSGGATNYASGSPGLIVETTGADADTVLIADGHTIAGANADDVLVTNVTQDNSNYLPAANTYDDLEQPVTTVDVSGLGVPIVEGDNLWIGWHSLAGVSTYGIYGDKQTLPLRGAGDLLIYLARLSRGLEWDFARLDTLREDLNQYIIDTYIMPEPGEPLTPYDWIQEYILSQMPVTMELGPRGIYLRWWPFTSDQTDAVCVIDADAGGCASRVELAGVTPRDTVIGSVIVNYNYNHRTGKPRDSVLLTGSEADADEDGILDPWLALALIEYGPRPGMTINLEAVEDRSTAIRIASAYAKRGGCQRAQVTYAVDQFPGGLLEPGSVALVIDTSLGWDKAVGIAIRTQWSDSGVMEIMMEVPIQNTGAAA